MASLNPVVFNSVSKFGRLIHITILDSINLNRQLFLLFNKALFVIFMSYLSGCVFQENISPSTDNSKPEIIFEIEELKTQVNQLKQLIANKNVFTVDQYQAWLINEGNKEDISTLVKSHRLTTGHDISSIIKENGVELEYLKQSEIPTNKYIVQTKVPHIIEVNPIIEEEVKVLGIIGGLIISAIALLLNFYSTMRSTRAQKISNYQEIVKSHRDLWKLTLQEPELYGRIFRQDVDIIKEPITYQERLFSQLLFLHMTAAHTFIKHSHIQPIEKLELDFYEVLLAPIPRVIWSENRKYYNSDFKHFIERANKQRGIKGMIYNLLSVNRIDYTKSWNVLLLTSFPNDIEPIIKRIGDHTIIRSDNDGVITKQFIRLNKIDFVVCFGYGHLLQKEVYSNVPCINIHGGMLPYNRGPNPNLWAWIDNIKKGVSIHYIDSGVDTGDLITQKEIDFFKKPVTLQSSFNETIEECITLFSQEWPKIRTGVANRYKQDGIGVVYTHKSQKPLEQLFDAGGADMPIEEFREKALCILGRKENE